MSAAAIAILSIAVGVGPVDPIGHPFDDTVFAPADVTLYLHVQDASQLRAAFRERPIGRFFDNALRRGVLAGAWEGLAAHAGLSGDEFFNMWLGKRFTLLVRDGVAGPDWALVTTIDPDRVEPVLDRLRLRRSAPRGAWAVAEWPEASLLFARDGATVIVGPTTPRRLFFDVLDRHAGEEGPTLAHDAIVGRARRTGPGRVGCFVRHDAFLGGSSAFVGDLRGEAEVVVRHVARFDSPPFARPRTAVQWDAAPLRGFESHALMATMEPNDIGLGQFGAFAEATLNLPLFSEEILTYLGGARILALGEVDGRLEPAPHDPLIPVGAVAFQLCAMPEERAAMALTAIDRHLVGLSQGFERLVEGTWLQNLPEPGRFAPSVTRHIDLAPGMTKLGGGFPVMRSASLNWLLTTSASGERYCVIATHPQQLAQTVEALAASPGPADAGLWTSVGTADGRRLARLLRSHAEWMASSVEADPDAANAVAETIRLLASLADGLERCRWQLRRPSREETDLSVYGRLSPAESSGR